MGTWTHTACSALFLILVTQVGGVKIGTSHVQGIGGTTTQHSGAHEPCGGQTNRDSTPWGQTHGATEGCFQLEDKRKLSYGWGYTPGPEDEENTMTVLALHGMGMGGFEMWPWPAITESGGVFKDLKVGGVAKRVRFVAISRPGYADSSPPFFGYSYQAFAKDVEDFINTATVEEGGKKLLFPADKGILVLGTSSGGPNMLALSYYLKHKVLAGASASGDAPYMHTQRFLQPEENFFFEDTEQYEAAKNAAENLRVAANNDIGLYAFHTNIPDFCIKAANEILPNMIKNKTILEGALQGTKEMLEEKGLEQDCEKGADQIHGADLLTFAQQWLRPFFKSLGVNEDWNGEQGFVLDYSLERIPWSFEVAHVHTPINIYTGGCSACKQSDFDKQGDGDFCPICASAPFLKALLPNAEAKTTFSKQTKDKKENNHFYSFKKPKALREIVQDLLNKAMDQKYLESAEPGICSQCKECIEEGKEFKFSTFGTVGHRAPGPPIVSDLDGGHCIISQEGFKGSAEVHCAAPCTQEVLGGAEMYKLYKQK